MNAYMLYISYKVIHALIQQHLNGLPNTGKSANSAQYFILTFYKMTILMFLALTTVSLASPICSKTVSQQRK